MSAVSDADEDAISLSLFRNAFDNEPRRVEVSWEYLVDRLCAPPVVLAKKEYVLSYSPAIFRGERGKETVEQVSFLSFDLDDIPAEAFQDVRRRIAGLAAVVYSTFQHADALTRNEGRYRLVLRLSRAVLASEWELFWYRARARYAPDADEQCTDASRIYFLPCVPSQDAIARHEAFALEGAAIDVDEILREPEPKRREPASDGWSRAIAMMGSTQAPNGGERWARTALENEANVLINAEKGTRNSQLNKSAFNLGQIVAGGGLTESEVVYALLGACAQNGLIADDGELSARRTLRSGLEKGQKTPRVARPKDDERVSGVHVAPKETAAAEELTAPDMAAICRSLPGKHKRIATYCDPLDAATGGGFQTGRIVVIGGPPGVTKTGWALAMGYTMARLGVYTSTGHHPVHVHVIAADEPRDGLLSRLGQMEGMSRSALDDEDVEVSKAAWEHTAACLARVPGLTIWDPRVEPVRVEDVARCGAEAAKAAGARLVLIVDSIREAPFSCDDPKVTLRERIDARMTALRRATLEHNACVIAISELHRGAYSGKEPKADLGSFKESGGIEYKADLALTMARVADPDFFLIAVTLHKSRLGDEPGFRLRRTAQCTFEVHREPDAVEIAEDIAEESKLEKICNELVLALVRAKGPVCTRKDMAALVKARKADAEAAVSRLITSGRIRGGKGVPFSVIHQAEDTG